MKYRYTNVHMAVLQVKNGYKYVGGITGHQDRDTHLELDNLEEGQYLLFVEMDWDNEQTAITLDNERKKLWENGKPIHKYKFRVTSYGPAAVTFSDVTNNWPREKILKQIV